MESLRKVLCSAPAIFVIAVGISFPSYAGHLHYSCGADFDLAIPPRKDGKGWMEDAMVFAAAEGIVIDIDVTVNITHSSVCDLQIYLQSPAGTRLCLNSYDIDDFIPFEKNFLWTTFDDQAQTAIEDGQSPFTGRFRPKSPGTFSVFEGESVHGIWLIQIYDAVYADCGTLHNVKLDFVVNPEPSTVVFLIMGIFWRKLRWQRKVKR